MKIHRLLGLALRRGGGGGVALGGEAGAVLHEQQLVGVPAGLPLLLSLYLSLRL